MSSLVIIEIEAGASTTLCSNFDTLSMVIFIKSSIDSFVRSTGASWEKAGGYPKVSPNSSAKHAKQLFLTIRDSFSGVRLRRAALGLRCSYRNRKVKRSPFPEFRLHPDFSAVALDDLSANRQADARP